MDTCFLFSPAPPPEVLNYSWFVLCPLLISITFFHCGWHLSALCKKSSQSGRGLVLACTVWTSSFRRELSSMKSLIHFIQFSYSSPLFAVSVGGQAFKDQYVLDSSFLFSDEHILWSLTCLNYSTRTCSLWHPGKSGCFSSSSLE